MAKKKQLKEERYDELLRNLLSDARRQGIVLFEKHFVKDFAKYLIDVLSTYS